MLNKRSSCRVTLSDSADVAVKMRDRTLELPTQRKFKDSGQMIAPATIARVGIQEYRAGECGALFKDRDPMSIVKIMTEEAELFDEATIESYRAAPITIDHPADDVSVENSGELQKGHLEGMPFRDEDGVHLSATIVLDDAEAIDLVQDGMTQVSCGHSCDLVLCDSGEYDAKKTNIRGNHVALVKRGRAKTATIADKATVDNEPKTYTQEEMDEVSVKLDVANNKIQTLQDALTVAEEKAKNLRFSDSDFEAKVKERVELLTTASTLTDKDLSGMSETEVKRTVLVDCLGVDLSGKTDSYIAMRYEAMLEEGVEQETSLTKALRDHAKVSIEDSQKVTETPRERMIKRHTRLEE